MQNKIQLNVKGMHCASCVLKVEKAIKKVQNVKEANVNLATEKATVNYEGGIDLNQIKKEVQKTGYDIELPEKDKMQDLQNFNERSYQPLQG